MSREAVISQVSVMSGRPRARGFTITDVLIAVALVGILVTIAVPSYTSSVVKSKRRAAQVCLSSFATQMERFYTTNLRYNLPSADPTAQTCADGDAPALPALDCASAQNTGRDYNYSVTATCSTYTLEAAPKTTQAARDAACGELSLDQAGSRGASGAINADGVAKCW